MTTYNTPPTKYIPSFYENCFDIIRLLAAIIVMLSHSYRWFGFEKPPCLLFLTDGSVGVIILYALSGFLTYASYDRIVKNGGTVWLFWFKRITRILPLYILASLFMVFIDISRGINILSLNYMFSRFLYSVTLGRYWINNGVTNGVLWSLLVEIIYYLIVPLVYILLNDKNLTLWLIIVLLLWQFNLWDAAFINFLAKYPQTVYFARIDNALTFIYEFLIGSMFYCHREKLFPIFSRKSVALILITIFSLWFYLYRFVNIIPFFGQMHNPIYGLIIPFITISSGYAFGKIKLKFDISYGIYLFHMLIIYEIIRLTPGGIAWMITACILTIIIAFILHYSYEKPVRKLTEKIEKLLESIL